MRVRRAQEHRVNLAVEVLVVLEAAEAFDEPDILEPPNRLADAEFHTLFSWDHGRSRPPAPKAHIV